MALPWQYTTDSKYLILDIDSNEILGFCDTDDKATRKAISESFGKNRNVEVFVSTGFNSWKNGLHQ